jgi:hypothetical protein
MRLRLLPLQLDLTKDRFNTETQRRHRAHREKDQRFGALCVISMSSVLKMIVRLIQPQTDLAVLNMSGHTSPWRRVCAVALLFTGLANVIGEPRTPDASQSLWRPSLPESSARS